MSCSISGKEFQGDAAAELRILGLVDDAHASGAKLLDDGVMRKGLPDQRAGVVHSASILGFHLKRVNEGARKSVVDHRSKQSGDADHSALTGIRHGNRTNGESLYRVLRRSSAGAPAGGLRHRTYPLRICSAVVAILAGVVRRALVLEELHSSEGSPNPVQPQICKTASFDGGRSRRLAAQSPPTQPAFAAPTTIWREAFQGTQ